MQAFEAPRRQTWALVLVATLGLAIAVWASQRGIGRISNLALPGGFTEVYVQYKVGDPSRCLVTDRAGATVRRSEPDLQAARWNCRLSSGGEALQVLDGQRASFLFVPYEEVVDPVYPFLYEALRQLDGEKPLPRLRWVHLFVDRTYRGFFLQATLPTRDFAEEKQLGELEMLTIRGSELFCYDRKLRGLCPLYGALIAESIFPSPDWSPASHRLAALLPADLPRSFLLSDQPGDNLRSWPLPFDLPRFTVVAGEDQHSYYDQRLETWRVPAGQVEGIDRDLLARAALAAKMPELRAGLVAERLRGALAASCGVRGCDAKALAARIDQSAAFAVLREAAP